MGSVRSGLANVPCRCVPGSPRLGLGVVRTSSHLNELAVILQHLPSKLRGSERARANPHVEKTIRLRVHEVIYGYARAFLTVRADRPTADAWMWGRTVGTFAPALCSCSRGICALG